MSISREIFAHRTGVLHRQETITLARSVICPRTGTLIVPIDHLHDREATLFIPEESHQAVQLHVELTPATTASAIAAIDRWQAYHGRNAMPSFAIATILGARLGTLVGDADQLLLINDVREQEGSTLRQLNSDKPKLCALIQSMLPKSASPLDTALAVGVDHFGIDIKLRTGIFRVEFDQPANLQTLSHAVASLFSMQEPPQKP